MGRLLWKWVNIEAKKNPGHKEKDLKFCKKKKKKTDIGVIFINNIEGMWCIIIPPDINRALYPYINRLILGYLPFKNMGIFPFVAEKFLSQNHPKPGPQSVYIKKQNC